MSGAVLLRAQGLCKRYGATAALDDVGLVLRAGEIHALMGQNGAGKSTLIRVLTGAEALDSGRMELDGRALAPVTPLDAQRAGISTVYQEVNLCPNLTVAENLFAGRYPRNRLGLINRTAMRNDARALLAQLHLQIDVDLPLATYPLAIQQMVAIARALGVSARVLILDEPTSSLDQREVAELFTVMRRLRDKGLAILFVSHFLDQVYAVSDRITVLRNGRWAGEFPADELPPSALVTAMVGRELSAAPARESPGGRRLTGAPVVEATGMGRRGSLHPLDITVGSGEVVGVGGLLGSGRTELARLLFGLDRPDSGHIRIDGERVELHHPADAIRRGLAMCPEDRKSEGIVAGLSVRENIVLALQARDGLWPSLSRAGQEKLANRFVEALGIKVADIETPVGALSGGNQQKVVLARWLATTPRLLILDEPTRGIDVAARQQIMAEMLRLADEGLSLLLNCTELDELTRLCDRIVVLRERRKAGELEGGCDGRRVLDMIAGQEHHA